MMMVENFGGSMSREKNRVLDWMKLPPRNLTLARDVDGPSIGNSTPAAVEGSHHLKDEVVMR